MGRTIPVMMAFDRGYLFPSCVAIHSVLEQADPADRYRFYILTAEENVGMDDGFFELLAAKFPNFAWEYRPVAVDMFANSRPAMRYISTATYYRLLIPCLFPELEYCIYLDGDLVALGDIAGMLDCCMDDSEGALLRLLSCGGEGCRSAGRNYRLLYPASLAHRLF